MSVDPLARRTNAVYTLINRGSLLTRNINDLIKKEDFIMDSEYLTTRAGDGERDHVPEGGGHVQDEVPRP